jgi:hypothetical protein
VGTDGHFLLVEHRRWRVPGHPAQGTLGPGDAGSTDSWDPPG